MNPSNSSADVASLRGKKIVVAKPGLDGHDSGAKVVALTLRDAGADVIYTGLRKSPGYIARIAVEEDADAVGLSILSGSHCELVEMVRQELETLGGGGIKLFVGGVIPQADHEQLKRSGVSAIFGPEMALSEMVRTLREHLA